MHGPPTLAVAKATGKAAASLYLQLSPMLVAIAIIVAMMALYGAFTARAA